MPDSPTPPFGTATMKKLIVLILLILVAVLNVGYYEALEDGDIETILSSRSIQRFRCGSTTSMRTTERFEKSNDSQRKNVTG